MALPARLVATMPTRHPLWTPQFRKFSTTHLQSASPFGANRREKFVWFAKSTLACAAMGLTLSATILTDENLAPVYDKMDVVRKGVRKLVKDWGVGLRVPITEAHAFSLPDHGLHPPHFPWDHHSWLKTYDHAAWV
jgi:ubiquinol-cytochrome c reductase cytochrome c1 subunit